MKNAEKTLSELLTDKKLYLYKRDNRIKNEYQDMVKIGGSKTKIREILAQKYNISSNRIWIICNAHNNKILSDN